MKTLSFRFDIDGVGDIEKGVPRLLDLARNLGVHFSFYVNMGKSVNLKWALLNKISKLQKKDKIKGVSLVGRHGKLGVMKALFKNPYIGLRYKSLLLQLISEGHELGLHGGMDHALWQYNISKMDFKEIRNLLLSAYKRFLKLFGKPLGFCSPGLSYNRDVLYLMDEFNFLYSSDMKGEIPFRPVLDGRELRHYQIPVNIIGYVNGKRVSLVNKLISEGKSQAEISSIVESEIKKRNTAVFYGHPSIEGIVTIDVLRKVIKFALDEGYEILKMKELVSRFGG